MQRCFNPRARKGRDSAESAGQREGSVSIHAPARGATRQIGHLCIVHCVSIHAPARGATSATTRLEPSERFQSTRPQGARQIQGVCHRSGLQFQSTRPQGARLSHLSASSGDFCFNPRARKGRDKAFWLHDEDMPVSIHAPARGATRGRRLVFWLRRVSIHAPARGATSRSDFSSSTVLFQSTRPQGARRLDAIVRTSQGSFNPRARKGRDR